MPSAAHLYGGALQYIGSIGPRGKKLKNIVDMKAPYYGASRNQLRSMGRKRAMIGGGAALGVGVMGRASGSRGLNSHSSAPPPMDPYR